MIRKKLMMSPIHQAVMIRIRQTINILSEVRLKFYLPHNLFPVMTIVEIE